jgi:hypothetical protein
MLSTGYATHTLLLLADAASSLLPGISHDAVVRKTGAFLGVGGGGKERGTVVV